MTDYLENAVEAAKDCLGLEEDGDYELVKGALRAAEPFIAEHHRADERARVEERLTDAHFVERLRRAPSTRPTNPASERDAIADEISRALNSEADQGEQGQ